MREIWEGDCLELMKDIPDKSIEMILCDLPYGTTACKWDTIIPFEPLWEQYKRIIKDNGAIVLTASQPFTSALVMSNPKMFKYEWVWDKVLKSGHLNAKNKPMSRTESVLIFSKKKINYIPIMEIGNPEHSRGRYEKPKFSENYGKQKNTGIDTSGRTEKYPSNLIVIQKIHPSKCIHPTQKPVALFEYLIKTYTNEGDLVLDNCAGSGTTGIACKNLNRQFILIEKEPDYVRIIKERLTP